MPDLNTRENAAAFRKGLIDLYRGYITPADGKMRWGRGIHYYACEASLRMTLLNQTFQIPVR
jgi:hypothetical protein